MIEDVFPGVSALTVDEAQKRVLESLARVGTTPQKLARKCKVLASRGIPNHAIAEGTGLSRPTVIATYKGFLTRGLQALRQPQKRKRSRSVLTSELEQKILDTTLKTRGNPLECTSARARQLGVSRMMLQRVRQRYET